MLLLNPTKSVTQAVNLFLQVPTANSKFHAKLSNDPGIGFFRDSFFISSTLAQSFVVVGPFH